MFTLYVESHKENVFKMYKNYLRLCQVIHHHFRVCIGQEAQSNFELQFLHLLILLNTHVGLPKNRLRPEVVVVCLLPSQDGFFPHELRYLDTMVLFLLRLCFMYLFTS